MINIINLLFSAILNLVSIYTISVNDGNGKPIKFSDYSGKKILIVNTASNGPDSQQYVDLEKLYQMHKDNLVIIAFPSNDFGNEPDENDEIFKRVVKSFNVHFIIAEKTLVSGQNKSYLYKWLSDESLNGMMNSTVKRDFYKYLIDGEGRLIGIFSNAVSPLSAELQSAITN